MVKFTKEKDELLIELVKGHSILYDASNENFKNTILKHKSWEEISAIVAVPVPECKKRWKSLRDQYNKKKKSDLIGAERWNSTNMSLLSFLSDTAEKRVNITNGDDPLQQIVVGVIAEETDDEEQQEEHDDEKTEQLIKTEVTKDPLNTDERAFNRNKKGFIKKPLKEPIKKMIAKRRQRSALYEKMLNKAPAIKTPTEKFFESMADIVDKLPPHLQAEVRLKVCQIVTEAELKHHTQQTLYPNLSQSFNQFSDTGDYSNTQSSENDLNSSELAGTPLPCAKFEMDLG